MDGYGECVVDNDQESLHVYHVKDNQYVPLWAQYSELAGYWLLVS